MRRKSCFCFLQEFPYYSPQQRAERQKDASGKPASNSVEMMHGFRQQTGQWWQMPYFKWRQSEQMRTTAGQRTRAGDRHKTVRRETSCQCNCRRGCWRDRLRESWRRSRAVSCGLWASTNAFFAVSANVASTVGGTLFSTYLGARAAIVGHFMGC